MVSQITFQDVLRRSGFVSGETKGDPQVIGITVGGKYLVTPATLTDGKFSSLTFTTDQKLRVDATVTASASIAPPTALVGFTKSVTTAGTRVALGTTLATKSIYIKANLTNTGLIYVGGVTVDSTNGIALAAGDSVTIDIADRATVYIDSSVNGEGVGATAFS